MKVQNDQLAQNEPLRSVTSFMSWNYPSILPPTFTLVQLISVNDNWEALGHLEQRISLIPTSSESPSHSDVGAVTCSTEQGLKPGRSRGPAVQVLGTQLPPPAQERAVWLCLCLPAAFSGPLSPHLSPLREGFRQVMLRLFHLGASSPTQGKGTGLLLHLDGILSWGVTERGPWVYLSTQPHGGWLGGLVFQELGSSVNLGHEEFIS